MKPTTTQASVAHVATQKETLTPREGTFLMMVAQLVVLTCIVLAATVGGRLGVKASGGIRTAGDAAAMLEAGATRLGLSGTRAVLDGLG